MLIGRPTKNMQQIDKLYACAFTRVVTLLHKLITLLHKLITLLHKLITLLHKLITLLHKLITLLHKLIKLLHKLYCFSINNTNTQTQNNIQYNHTNTKKFIAANTNTDAL